MEAMERALKTAEAQIEEAKAIARIRIAFASIIVSNAQALFEFFAENETQRKMLERALDDKNADSSMLHRGLLIQVNGIFESFVRSICEAVLQKKTQDAGSFNKLEEKIRNEYIQQAAYVLTFAKEGNVRGAG